LCAKSLEQALQVARDKGLTPRCVISVDIFGQPAAYNEIEGVSAKANDLWLMSDAAQSFGASYQGRKVGTIGLATTTSFFPAKPLGCYGDGGAVFTDNDELAEIMKSLRVHGKGSHKYDNARIGLNARMDTMQAAIVIEKLKLFPQELTDRQKVADRYEQGLKDIASTPELLKGNTSSWAQYTLKLNGQDRDAVADALKAKGVPTAVYYPKPLHQQTAYKQFPSGGKLEISEKLAQQVLSLPMHPYMDEATQDYIIQCVREVLAK
jgi:dTDP-4-amino-4,6-dideoxygalactose transaminase